MSTLGIRYVIPLSDFVDIELSCLDVVVQENINNDLCFDHLADELLSFVFVCLSTGA